jgi:pimeloyl-ACP methyl ester carboxylesterase
VSDWQKEIDDNLRLAQALGSRVDLAGYSVGGMLAADAKLRNPELSYKLILHSPAFVLAADRQKKVLDSADAGQLWTAELPSTAYNGFDGYRYAQTSAPAFARALRFGEKIRERWKQQRIVTPVFLIEASNDRMADAQAIESFAISQDVPARRRLVVRGPHARTVQAGEGSSAPELQAFLHGLNN